MEEYIAFQLAERHVKKDFTCGKEMLDNYIRYQANQDIKRRLSACFVIVDDKDVVKGYYTLSNTSISKEGLPLKITRKFPPTYKNIPATLLGRLAVDKSIAGQGYGKLLLIDALKRSYITSTKSIGSIAVIVDPLDDDAVRFYEKYGFTLLPDSGKMFIPMSTISDLDL
jgi:GNAT superfamily N-acetyltransferase